MRLTFVPALLAVSALAQTPASPAFDVASVKINQDFNQANRATWAYRINPSPGSLTMRNVNMTMIAAWAFHLQRPQVSTPSALDDQRYDILAKTDHPAKDDELRQMLQKLLVERFKFASHRTTRTMEVLALVAPKEGLKMKESQIGDGPIEVTKDENGAHIKGAQLVDLLDDLSKELEIPVVDMTGLKGRYDFTFNPQKYVTALRARYTGERNIPPESALKLSLMEEILTGELGLRVETRKAPVEMLVIDHAEKTPAEN
jgi:uncharacterized protein (TIGR03435 family)